MDGQLLLSLIIVTQTILAVLNPLIPRRNVPPFTEQYAFVGTPWMTRH